MRIFVAGASGAIGQPLIAELIRLGHSVTGMTQSDAGAKKLAAQGASATIADAFDRASIEKALKQSQPEVVIDELTSLPKNPVDLPAYSARDRKLRLEGGGNLHQAALACGVRRYIQQGSGFYLKAGPGLADESVGLAIDASPGVAASAQMYAAIEERTLKPQPIEGIVLRYGFFYGPNTWYSPDGGAADQARAQQLPIVGEGLAVWSFVHIEDAAIATAAALTAEPGIYNIVDNDPTPVHLCVPKFAAWVGAPQPPHITEEMARAVAGEDAVYYNAKLRGATNEKARNLLNFKPRRLQWL
ncbi:NAD(P)-dependent oxidoreductase [Tunturibacter psychrotolerans]|uniref:NAD(P)-dependent oxidoreductase n=1 Tax=Tunturiibacter psychrotolerans TaxID=3069686 RepID=A0AAU7ZSH0_9BACT